jgi:hypothetical protein
MTRSPGDGTTSRPRAGCTDDTAPSNCSAAGPPSLVCLPAVSGGLSFRRGLVPGASPGDTPLPWTRRGSRVAAAIGMVEGAGIGPAGRGPARRRVATGGGFVRLVPVRDPAAAALHASGASDIRPISRPSWIRSRSVDRPSTHAEAGAERKVSGTSSEVAAGLRARAPGRRALIAARDQIPGRHARQIRQHAGSGDSARSKGRILIAQRD